jgi:pimeloyl-ACP methyl ester carboxylesterase
MTVHGFDGPPVVKLAGIVGGIHLYNEEVTLAARAGFRVAALDVSGDRHDDPTKRTLGWDLYADEVVRDRQPVRSRALLWGTSFGSLVALATAARHPERVAGLLLSHPPTRCDADASTLRSSMGRAPWRARTPSPTCCSPWRFWE